MHRNDRPLLTIGVMSYNRPIELRRLLSSIPENSNIEVVVSDDSSPNISSIRQVVRELSKSNIVLHEAEENQGFDLNLKKMIACSSGQFILLMADDDYFQEGSLEKLLTYLASTPHSLILSGYADHITNEKFRVRNKTVDTEYATGSGRFTYDLIMISGLIFRAANIPSLNVPDLVGSIYSQVYLGLLVGAREGAHYYGDIIVLRGQDGVNGFGNTGDPRKVSRDRYTSNLAFHEGLIRAVRRADMDLNMDGALVSSYAREYSLRTITGFVMSAKYGRSEIVSYYGQLRKLDLRISFLPHIAFPLIWILGRRGTRFTFGLLRNGLVKVRR